MLMDLIEVRTTVFLSQPNFESSIYKVGHNEAPRILEHGKEVNWLRELAISTPWNRVNYIPLIIALVFLLSSILYINPWYALSPKVRALVIDWLAY